LGAEGRSPGRSNDIQPEGHTPLAAEGGGVCVCIVCNMWDELT
jgi:hypothetical protein